MKILLHACCAPCSLEPVRLLHEAGHDLSIAYSNSNIAPAHEYDRRFDTLLSWAREEGIPVIEGTYDPQLWEKRVAHYGRSAETRKDRCRACYALRLEEVAAWAAQEGFDAIASTLTVSPYQYTDVIEEELVRVAQLHGLIPLFEDFRPFYENATRRSLELGMYRQNYCGCRFSAAEAAEERRERKRQRALQKEEERKAHAAERAQAEQELQNRRAEHAAYNKKQARKRALLKQFKEQQKAQTS